MRFLESGMLYQMFLVLVALAWLLTFLWVRRNKSLVKQMLWVSAWSLPGGLLVGAWHRSDFWNPASWLGYPVLQSVFTLEDALFGFFFAGFVAAALPFLMGEYPQEQPLSRRVVRKHKVGWLILSLVAAGVLSLMPMNSVAACSGAFLLSAAIICFQRPDLRYNAVSGAVFTLIAYGTLIGLFLLLILNRVETQSLCQFCDRQGPLWTGVILTFWAPSFGAWISVLYPFIRNKRFVVYLRQAPRSR